MPSILQPFPSQSSASWRGGVQAAGIITVDPDVEVLPEQKEEDRLDQPWNVIIFNDPVNLMSFVSMIIQRVFGYSRAKAEEMMLAVHRKGKCIVWTGLREPAEMYVQQLQSWQLLVSMQKAE